MRATEGSLPCRCYLLAPLTGNKERSKGIVVLQVKRTPTRFPTHILYTLMANTHLHSLRIICHPWGKRCRTAVWSMFVSYLSKHLKSPFGHFLKAHCEEHQGNSRNWQKTNFSPYILTESCGFTQVFHCPWLHKNHSWIWQTLPLSYINSTLSFA